MKTSIAYQGLENRDTLEFGRCNFRNSVNTLLFDRICRDNARTPPKLAIYLRHIFNVPIYSLDFPAAKEMNVLVGIGTLWNRQ
jgi:hypothetical protein